MPGTILYDSLNLKRKLKNKLRQENDDKIFAVFKWGRKMMDILRKERKSPSGIDK